MSTSPGLEGTPATDDLKLLLDDHTLLSSSVIHGVALVRRLAAGRFEATALHAETSRQVELIREQLIQHFEFEEAKAFPRLEVLFPAQADALQQFVAEHDGILQTLDLLRTDLSFDRPPADGRNLQKRALAFERVFEAHATAETNLFNELASKHAGR
jgi:iron-sulfur cluster repair protein YtfE (RIC family)